MNMKQNTTAFRLVYVTAPDSEIAAGIASTIVSERLAACANILPEMHSVYHWEGKVEQSREVVLLFKTQADLIAPLMERITALHPYDVPCIMVLDIADGLPAFLNWIAAETKQPATDA